MSSALCFKCGAKKTDATKLCNQCMSAPRSFDDLVLSYCLSSECVKPETLTKCREYLIQKKRPPKFRQPIIDAATLLAEQHGDAGDLAIDFPSTIFEIPELSKDEPPDTRKTVAVQVIGRRQGHADDEPPTGLASRQKTYHSETWIVGKDIPEEQVNEHLDGNQIFVWYRWIQDRWCWNCISRGKFAQLKAVEDGNPF